MASNRRTILLATIKLQVVIFLFSLCGVLMKMASNEMFLSVRFILFYGGSLIIMFIYSFLWQLSLKNVTLTTAYTNRSFSSVWSVLWGAIIFGERISVQMILGGLVIVVGIWLVVDENV